MGNKRKLSIFLAIVLLVTFVTGTFSASEAHAASYICTTPYGNYPGEDLNHNGMFAGYTRRYGVDVSKYQGYIDWQKVAASGVEFAFIRIGNMGVDNGSLYEDPMAYTNLWGAINAGLKVGVYFYSHAINEAEAVQEAEFTLNLLSSYGITPAHLAMPIMMDVEFFSADGYNYSGRLYYANLSVSQRTSITLSFLNRVAAAGYSAGLYAGRWELGNWHDMSQIAGKYYVWVAAYMSSKTCPYYGWYNMWQYSCYGTIPGIPGYVDINVWYDPTPQPAPQPQPEEQTPSQAEESTQEEPAQTTEPAKTDVVEPQQEPAKEEPKQEETKPQVATSIAQVKPAVQKTEPKKTEIKPAASIATPSYGWSTVDGATYFTAANGQRLVGLHTLGGMNFYFDDEGKMLTGWQTIDGKKYYFGNDGYMRFGWTIVDDAWYLLDIYNGEMIEGKWIDGYWIGASGVRGHSYKDINYTAIDVRAACVMHAGYLGNATLVSEDGQEFNDYTTCYMR